VFPKRERAYATSIFNAAPRPAPIIAHGRRTVPRDPPMAWPMPFIIAGVAGFVWLVFWLPMYKTPEQHPRCNKTELDC